MNMLSRILARRVMFAITLLILASCTVVVDEGGSGPIRDDGPICTREYDPVCARRGGEWRTFHNACVADSAGFRVVRRGECRGGGDEGGGPRFCTREYDPVCARRGGERRTFANSCLADGAGYRVIRNGECRGGGDGSDWGGGIGGGGGGEEPRACTREYRPVCAARRGAEPRTFPNACEAQAAHYRVVGEGPC